MVDKYAIERALLIGVIREHKWDILILNSIDESYFSYANKPMYRYVKEYADKNEYPDIQIVCYKFEIDDDTLQDYIQISDIQALCDELRKEYLSGNLAQQVGRLNENSEEINTDPAKFIERMGQVYEDLKTLSFKNKTVGLFDNIEEILKIDPSDVISSGFAELDEKLVGWKRGEELIIFTARTGQGKSWMGLKFAFAAALQGERVGIYSGEMSLQQLQERIICCAKQSYTSTKEEALQFIKEHNIDIRILTQKELRRKANVNDIEEMIVRDKLSMVIVDQLSLMEDSTSKPGTPLRQQYGNISMDLFSLTSKYNLPIVLLVQSNRQATQEQNGPTLENIAESDAVAQNATRVISMKNENGILTLNIVKNRYGESGLSQRYEVDYGINKYKPIKEYSPEIAAIKKAKARAMFAPDMKF